VAGAETKPGQGRPFGQPAFQQFGERSGVGRPGRGSGERRGSGEAGSAINAFNAFVGRLTPTGERRQHQETGLQLAHPFEPFHLMHSVNLWFEGYRLGEDVGFEPTEEQSRMLKHVKLAYGIIAHPFCETKTSSGEPSHIYQR
jgi:hypothetical protein